MAPAASRQRQGANTKVATPLFSPVFPEWSGSSYFQITDKIAILKMVIKNSVLIRERKTDDFFAFI